MPNANKILKYYQEENFIKNPFAIYFKWKCLLEKMSTCYDDSEKSSTIQKN